MNSSTQYVQFNKTHAGVGQHQDKVITRERFQHLAYQGSGKGSQKHVEGLRPDHRRHEQGNKLKLQMLRGKYMTRKKPGLESEQIMSIVMWTKVVRMTWI